MNEKLNIAVVEDHPIVIEGLTLLLSKFENINRITSFVNGSSFLTHPDLKNIHLVLLDVFLPDMNGIDVCAKLKKLHPKMIVLGMSSQSERSLVIEMMKNGANGYLLKSATIQEFKECLQLASEGKPAFSHEVKAVVQQLTVDDLKSTQRLTKREKEVLQLLKQGKTTQEISDILILSFLTIQTHRRNLLNKFQVKNVVELLNYVKENGLL